MGLSLLLSSLFSEQARREARRRKTGGECWGKEGVAKRRVGDGQQQQQQQQQQADAKGVGEGRGGEICSEKDDNQKKNGKQHQEQKRWSKPAKRRRGGVCRKYLGATNK